MRRPACLALLATLLAGGGANAMSYGLVPFQDGSTAIVAEGRIERNEAAGLIATVQAARARGADPRTLIISSPGGNLDGALDLGRTLRHLGLRTAVGALARDGYGGRHVAGGGCHSACVMVLMAGVGRAVVPGSEVGVHSPRTYLVAAGARYMLDDAASRSLTGPALRSYARRMGVSTGVIDMADRVPHTSIRTLSPAELRRTGLVTGGSGRRTATRQRGRA